MHSKTEGVCTTWEYDRIWVNLIESSVRVGNYYIFNKLRRRSGEIEASDFRKKGWKKLTGSALRDRTSLFLFRSWPSTSWIKRKDWNGLNLNQKNMKSWHETGQKWSCHVVSTKCVTAAAGSSSDMSFARDAICHSFYLTINLSWKLKSIRTNFKSHFLVIQTWEGTESRDWNAA